MPLSHKERISRGLDAFALGLWPVLDDAMTRRSNMGGNWIEQYPGENLQSDVAAQIRVAKDHRASVFRYVLSKDEFNWLFEVADWRNKVSHGSPVSGDDAYRALDTMERVLTRHNPDAAAELLSMKQTLLRERANAEVQKAKPKAETLFSGEVTGLKPWREVILPHPDVAQGRFSAAEFAADLFMVAQGQGSTEYTSPIEFFSRTYLTEGLAKLLTQAVHRIGGDSGAPPVIDLQTTFGGGKTHSMISLYHLFSGTSISEFPQEVQDLLGAAGVDVLPDVKRAVVVGTRLSPAQPDIKEDGTEVGTIWGEIAWQLGGRAGFDAIAQSDHDRGNPGDHIRKVIEAAAPCLILIDEWVAYAAQLLGERDLRGGDFNSQFYFAQTLTEIVKQVDGALLVVSLPASVDTNGLEISAQVSGDQAHEALTKLRDAVGRTKDAWTPAKAEESFEIVRRRLFEPPSAEDLRHIRATARVYSEFYNKQAAEFPPETKEAEYSRRLERSYPIHPELFTRLYDDWSTLERFQQTRGVLRLLAQVIHALWSGNDRSPMIMPGLVPLDDPTVSSELVSNLSEQWPPIIHRDVDGEDSTPRALDLEYPALNQYAATRRVARTILIGSAPSANQGNRGIEIQRVRLGSVLPGEQVAVFNDALAKLLNRATYLYGEGTRYWFGTQAHVGQLARDRADQIRASRMDLVEVEISERLTRETRARGSFSGVHVMPRDPSDVADTDSARLVVLGPDVPQQGRSESPATVMAEAVLAQRGAAARVYRNMLVFLAADQKQVEALYRAAAEYLAWQQIDDEKVALNLDPLNQQQVERRRQEADAALNAILRETYKIAIVPGQSAPAAPLEFDIVRCDGPDGIAERCAKKLVNQGMLAEAYSPEMLRKHLDDVLAPVWETGDCTVGEIWDVLARYTYLPRLTTLEGLIEVLTSGANSAAWGAATWALASGRNDDGSYIGLIGGEIAVGVNATWRVVKPEVAMSQFAQTAPKESGGAQAPESDTTTGVGSGVSDAGVDGSSEGSDASGRLTQPLRFYGVKQLDATSARMGRDFESVSREVIGELQRVLGATVTVKVDIEASVPEGFDEATVRTVLANAETLRFEDFSFEAE